MGCLLSFVIPCNTVMNNHVHILFILHGCIFKGRSRSRSQKVEARGKLLGRFVRCWQILPLRGCHCASAARNVRMDPSWLVNVLDTTPLLRILCPSGLCLYLSEHFFLLSHLAPFLLTLDVSSLDVPQLLNHVQIRTHYLTLSTAPWMAWPSK